ncbi:MAG: hypothetical protein ACKOB1_12270 [Planctomycetia bacterium]
MHTARFLLVIVTLLGLAPLAASYAAEPTTVGKVTSLADRLKTGLRARRPEETEFLDRVAHLVRTGELPAKVVDSTYLWALQRQQKHPYPLFERALRIQADRLGVEL